MRKCITRWITTWQRLRPKEQANRLPDVEAKAFSDTLSDRLAELKLAKVGETLTNQKAASPVLTLLSTLAVMKPVRQSEHPA